MTMIHPCKPILLFALAFAPLASDIPGQSRSARSTVPSPMR